MNIIRHENYSTIIHKYINIIPRVIHNYIQFSSDKFDLYIQKI